MASSVERIQAPAGGVNIDAAPDSVPATQAPLVQNMLPGRLGRVVMRGALQTGLQINGGVVNAAQAVWAHGDNVLLKTSDGSTKTWLLSSAFTSASDVTATLVESPLDSRHARYGDYVYGAITDAAAPQLGKWNGAAAAIVPQSNAPFRWTDLQVYANRLFILGGTVPGTTTPVVSGGRVLFWSDTPTTGGTFPDLDTLDAWKDDVSGLVNQIRYDADDNPIGLAGCGRYLAIVGSRSINILTGTGSSSFAIRNLTRSWGCVDVKSIVEVDDGFFYMSERGYCYCDGATVVSVSDAIRDYMTGEDNYYAAPFGHGYIALALGISSAWLFHIASRTWTQFTSAAFADGNTHSVHRSVGYPLIWDGDVMWVADGVTAPDGIGQDGIPAVIGFSVIPARVKSHVARLGSPSTVAAVRRVLVDYMMGDDNAAWSVDVKDDAGNTLGTGTAAGETGGLDGPTRKRAQFDLNAEASTIYLDIAYDPTGTPNPQAAELYDCWIEFDPGRDTPGF